MSERERRDTRAGMPVQEGSGRKADRICADLPVAARFSFPRRGFASLTGVPRALDGDVSRCSISGIATPKRYIIISFHEIPFAPQPP
jgi:hypothetical protein